MIKQNQRILNIINLVSDGLLLFLCYYLSLFIRFVLMDGIESVNLRGGVYLWLVAGYCAAAIVLYYMMMVYAPRRYRRVSSELGAILLANLICTLLLAAVLFVLKLSDFSRVLIVTYFLVSTLAVWIKHILLRLTLNYVRRMGFNLRHIVLVGSGRLAEQYAKNVQERPQLGFRIDGYIGTPGKTGLGKYLGDISEVRDILAKHDADEVIIALSADQESWLREAINAANYMGIRAKVIPQYNDYIPENPSIDVIGSSKLINLNASPLDNVLNAMLKRAMDIVLSLVGIILISPVLLVIAIGVKLSSPGPVLFVQERVGRNKKTFKMLKFRSMRVNTEANTAWSTNSDPRKTVFGSFLRKTSLDELPQLFNVLAGQMSLVGPRPEIPFHVEHFQEEIPSYLVRQQVRPGMTGWAQVNGYRGDTDIRKRIELDLWYINNWCVRLDLVILMRTALGGFLNREKVAVHGEKAGKP